MTMREKKAGKKNVDHIALEEEIKDYIHRI